MPKIVRSIDYTFEAYSGVEDRDDKDVESGGIPNNHSSTAPALDEDEESDMDENSMDSRNLDDPPMIDSPPGLHEDSPERPKSPISLESYNLNTSNGTLKILSKGSKKWIGDDQPPLQPLRSPEVYQIEHQISKETLNLQTEAYERSKLSNIGEFSRHEASNASLLVEAALDSVCSEPGNIDIDVNGTSSCTEALMVNNLYTLAPADTLPDVTYSESVCISEQRDINLISPSVNEHISVTDELGDNLRQNHQGLGMDYPAFHQEDFAAGNSPDVQHRASLVRSYINNLSPPGQNHPYGKMVNSPVPVPSPPRYDFGHAVNDHLSSDDSNGMAAQNLSLHSKSDIQLDLSVYKSPYSKMQEHDFQARKEFRFKFIESEISKSSKSYTMDLEGGNKNTYTEDSQMMASDSMGQNGGELSTSNLDMEMNKNKDAEEEERNRYSDIMSTDLRTKLDLDLDLRIKAYDNDPENLRARNLYENHDLSEFRNKNYESVEKVYEGATDSDFRGADSRNFEPLLLNSSELQGLDMSARSFHNYPNINRYHHLYPDIDRVDLRINYSPPAPSYSHADILRVVSLDLTPPGRHSVDLSLRSHSLHQIANSRLLSEHALPTASHRLLDQSRLLGTDLSGRILSDHTTSRILSSNDQITSSHLLSEDSRILPEQSRLLEQPRLIGDGRILPSTSPNSAVSPVPAFSSYSVSQTPYHPTPLAPRPHVSSPTPSPYHHYSTYY